MPCDHKQSHMSWEYTEPAMVIGRCPICGAIDRMFLDEFARMSLEHVKQLRAAGLITRTQFMEAKAAADRLIAQTSNAVLS